jgi:hypothetical protein
MAVLEENFPSRSYFEYLTQHSVPDFLYTLHLHRGEFDHDLSHALGTCAVANPVGFTDNFSRLEALWETQRKIDQVLLEKGITTVPSPDDIKGLWQESRNLVLPFSLQTFIHTILELAAVRFAHLPS